jgi:hypothetical protein
MMTATHCVMGATVLNAAHQIICIRKQHTNQIRAEGNNTKCVGKKRFNGSVTHGLQKEHVLRSPPSHFGQGKIIYANHLP